MDSTSSAAILHAELLAHRTWPCEVESRLGDWILRAASGFTRRANSALAIGSAGPCLDATLASLAAWSNSHGIIPCIKITPLAEGSLDAALEERGWTVATPSRVMRRDLGAPDMSDSDFSSSAGAPRFDDTPTDEWLSSFFAWDGTPPDRALRHRELLERMPSPRFASWIEDGRAVALVALVRDEDEVHLYDMVVSPRRRREGIGRRFLAALLAHLRSEGVACVHLQVLADNGPAISLYSGLGFAATHRYHYREAPSDGVVARTSGC